LLDGATLLNLHKGKPRYNQDNRREQAIAPNEIEVVRILTMLRGTRKYPHARLTPLPEKWVQVLGSRGRKLQPEFLLNGQISDKLLA
jgi:hypothetical protein